MRNVTSFEGVAVPVAALEGIPLLEGLQPDELIAVAASMRFRELRAAACSSERACPDRACS